MSNYLFEVTNLFLHRRGGVMQLSPLDWQLISEWENDGIPLHVVLRAINDVFDNLETKPMLQRPRIKSISYCEEAIENAYDQWLELQVGK
jgi:hypothetical protein